MDGLSEKHTHANRMDELVKSVMILDICTFCMLPSASAELLMTKYN